MSLPVTTPPPLVGDGGGRGPFLASDVLARCGWGRRDVVHTLVAPDVLAVQHTNPIVTIPAGINRCRRIKLLRRFTVSIVSRDHGSPDRIESIDYLYLIHIYSLLAVVSFLFLIFLLLLLFV